MSDRSVGLQLARCELELSVFYVQTPERVSLLHVATPGIRAEIRDYRCGVSEVNLGHFRLLCRLWGIVDHNLISCSKLFFFVSIIQIYLI